MSEWIGAAEAARLLGVRRQTLYTYVSRGELQAHVLAGSRQSRYRAADIARLQARQTTARRPREAAKATLDWGLPVLRSSLTLIVGERLYYRGQDALALARHATLEDVAALLWQCPPLPAIVRPTAIDDAGPGSAASPPRRRRRACASLAAQPSPAQPSQALACLARFVAESSAMLPGDSRSPDAIAALLGAMLAAVAPQCPDRFRRPARPKRRAELGPDVVSRGEPLRDEAAPIHLQLARTWGIDAAGADLLRRALVLCADHELNASGFTVRCAASTGATMKACVVAGMAALSGPMHGGMTAVVEQMWDDVLVRRVGGRTLAARVGRWHARITAMHGCGGAVAVLPGFGHQLYPSGDPRASDLLAALPADRARERLAAEIFAQAGLRPALDFALVAVRRALGLPEGAAFGLFALGRSVGWIAHALEQRRDGTLIRPRAEYVGPMPAAF